MLHYRKQQGFVLLMVLLLMQVFVLLNCQALENILLLQRFNENILMHEKLYQQGVSILAKIEQSLVVALPSCMIPFIEPQEWLTKPFNAWESGATCTGNFHEVKYYYVIEFLTLDPCAWVEHVQAMAGYFRVTLFLQLNSQHIWLQSVLVRPVIDQSKQCKELLHRVELGRQSWRQLK